MTGIPGNTGTTGIVYLIGAGPGDPDLFTVKGLRLLRQADVVVYDRLIPAELLDEARPDAELIYAGKAPQKHRLSQDAINAVIVDRALAGYTVVRLKGGDPFIFGRGGEEAFACHAAGVPFEVVPGVSSINGVTSYAGIPLTHRHVSTGFLVVTGHEDPNKPISRVQYEQFAQFDVTLVILMGVTRLPQIMVRLIDAGLDPLRPAACIEQGATPHQRVIEGAAHELPDLVAQASIKPPALIVIGEVVALREQGLRWYDKLPELVQAHL